MPGFPFFLSVYLRIQSCWEFLYLPVFVSVTLLEHWASFSNIKHFEENEKRHLECAFCWSCLNFLSTTLEKKQTKGLCIKVGRAQGDGGIRTRVWGLGTWGRETRDLRTSSMGRGDVWDGDAGTSYTGTQGTQDVNGYCNESEVNAISLSSWKCVIDIMVNIRFHLPKPHWTPYTQNISL